MGKSEFSYVTIAKLVQVIKQGLQAVTVYHTSVEQRYVFDRSF